MRAYGNNTDILIDRNREAKSHALLADRQLAPPLLARFDNGLLYKYIQGRVCTPQDLMREPIWRAVAKKLAEWHARLPIESVPESEPLANGCNGVEGKDIHSDKAVTTNGVGKPAAAIANRYPTPSIWTVLQKWVLALPCGTETEQARKLHLQKELERSFHELDSTTGLGKEGLILGHCDLLSANVIMLPQINGITETSKEEAVSFIDYEYAVPCPAAFDIANHFAEWAGYDLDYDRIPTRSVRREFLKEYLASFASHSSQTLDPSMLDRLDEDIDRYRGMPGFYWGVWALIQATISKIDFDYAGYAEDRLGEYWAWREEMEGTREKSKKTPLREKRWAQEM